MRIAIACMMHETNTFNRIPTTLDQFAFTEGSGVYDHARWQGDDLTRGMIDELFAHGVEVVPLAFARGLPGGTVVTEVHQKIESAILEQLMAVRSVDAVCLALHGSMICEHELDPEGRLAMQVRDIVGPDTPITVGLDMHAKISLRLQETVNGLVAFKTAPHIDEAATGAAAARMGMRASAGSDLCVVAQRIPLLVAGEKSESDVTPMREIIEKLTEAEQQSGIHAASIVLGFPWADTPYAGVTVALTADCDYLARAHDWTDTIAEYVWKLRERFVFTSRTCEPTEAIEYCKQVRSRSEAGVADGVSSSFPIIISDSGDNPTAGAEQNMSLMLSLAVGCGISRTLVSAIADPIAYEQIATAGSGSSVTVVIGTLRHRERAGFRWRCTIHDVRQVLSTGVAVVCDGSITCILTDRRISTADPTLIYALGIDPTEFDCLIVKCGYQGPEYKGIASESILALTPGDSNERLDRLEFEAVPRPIYPLDQGIR